MEVPGRRSQRVSLAPLALLSLVVTLAACGGGAGSGPQQPSPTATKGALSVLYAGSLVNLMEHDLGPAFAKASGYAYEGYGAGSTELVSQIKGGVRYGDVFVSASPSANQGLQGSANRNLVTWYATFAKAPLVLGYNANSAFASDFRSRPWYQVITEPNIRIGRTDPTLDPKGKLTVDALTQAASTLNMPSLTAAEPSFAVFPEETLVGRLESGQLDAGFFYSNEAKEQSIPTVPLTPVSLSATYTVTVLNNAEHPAAGTAFVAYLLSSKGQATLTRHGITVLQPSLTGDSSAVPSSLRSLFSSG
ncbi:MAG: extracellular solute-binding protein [Nocardiopsaceae bacterium]|jgi:molybdate/tungstate transport system substrate-binding protein|nr:extracellular solute-binding protein [Nocardiopsaceae bacterium]